MDDSALRLSSIGFRIGILLILLVVLHVIAFAIYQGAHATEALSTQLWNYIESDTFKLITISLILPLLLLFLENHFKILETLEKDRKEWEKALQEERKKLVERRTERRFEAIEETEQVWNELYSLCSEVAYFSFDEQGTQGEKAGQGASALTQIIKKLENFSNSAEDVVNAWSFWFPNLSSEHQDTFLVFLNTLLKSAAATAYHIQKHHNPAEIAELQDTLLVIQNGIKTVAHHGIISILKLSMELLELAELRAGSGPSDKERELQSQIETRIESMRSWAEELKQLERTHTSVLPLGEDADAEEFLGTAQEIENWLQDNRGKHPNEAEAFDKLRESFFTIPYPTRMGAFRVLYPKAALKQLADWLSFESICLDLIRRAT